MKQFNRLISTASHFVCKDAQREDCYSELWAPSLGDIMSQSEINIFCVTAGGRGIKIADMCVTSFMNDPLPVCVAYHLERGIALLKVHQRWQSQDQEVEVSAFVAWLK